MSEKPIIFSAPMVLAILAGRKTQTRRIIKPAPFIDRMGNFCAPDRKGKVWNWGQHLDGRPCTRNFIEKHALVASGDRLWVRENFTVVPATAYRMSDGVQQTVDPSDRDMAAIYAAGWERSIPKWRPSIHMPRWASRISLEVTGVRVERLQDISEDDAAAEGVRHVYGEPFDADSALTDRRRFQLLWESIHGEGSWAANPLVWVYEFRSASIDEILKTTTKSAA